MEDRDFNEIVRKYQKKIYYLCYRMVENEEDAKDLSQEVFVKVYLKLKDFKGKSSLFTWIYRIACNICINFTKKKKIKFEELKPETTADSANPEKDLQKKYLSIQIEKAINTLPPKQRAVFVMRNYENLQHKEIAEIMGKSLGTVKSNYHQAVFKLRELLAPLSGVGNRHACSLQKRRSI